MRSRRDTELFLLLAASPAVGLLFALVHGAARSTLGWMDFAVPLGLLAAFLGAHVAARFFAPGADPVLLPVTFLLSGTGVAFITRLDSSSGANQVLWMFAGVIALVGTLVLVPSLERLARYKYTIALAGVGLLILPAIIGVEVNGAKLWLRFAGMSFQEAYAHMDAWVIQALAGMGIEAWYQPLNDITSASGKIAGAAQARRGNAVLHHVTMAYDIDATKMLEVLRIGREKLSDKGTTSAQKRVDPLRSQTGLARVQVIAHLIDMFRQQYGLADDTLRPEELDLANALAIGKFAGDEWIGVVP